MARFPKLPRLSGERWMALRIAAIYALLGALWILLSDRALAALVSDAETLTRIQTYKGWFYVLTTAGLLYLLIRRSVAAQRRAQQALERSRRDVSAHIEVERMKDEFVANVSHELRTPLSTLKLYLELLEGKVTPDVRDGYVLTLRRETERLHRIVEDLLRLSRLEQGGTPLDMEPTDLNALAAEYVADRAPLAASRGLSLRLGEQPPLPSVEADRGLLGQVMSIVLTNALAYTPSGGEVVVNTHQQIQEDGLWVGFSVADSGPGVAPDEHGKLFGRFYRGRAGLASRAPGTGLGLAIATEIMTRHAGRIEIDGDGVGGRGVTFRVWLPAERA